ncbi:diglucosyl diacylglycerol synthase [Bacillus songklensis]|uniref:Diglucosyl diacylglycerol synthase n=1 Tax=Bacillus songklensis TaxID=1069116 RepID=A0ABV8B428_9BACI
MKRPKILILTAEYGNGHVQVANVLKEQFNKYNVSDVIISSIYAESYPTLTPISETIYLKSFTTVGKPIYSLCYHGIEKIYNKKIARWFVNLGRKRLSYLVETEKPDVIINTFPVLAVSEFRRQTGMNIPTFNIITDYCLHKTWVSSEIDKYYVATQHVKEAICQLGISPSVVKVSGIPVRAPFEQSLSPSYLFQKYNLNPYKKTILMMAGAFGVLKNLNKICETLLMNNDCQLVIVCGKNKKLKTELEVLRTKFKNKLHVYGYVERVDELFRIASFMITKPGGITLTEATAIGVPVILYKPTPGQEKGNAIYFEHQNGAVVTQRFGDIFKAASHLLNNDHDLERMKRSIHSIHQPNAAKTIVEDVLQTIYAGEKRLYRKIFY